MIKKLGQDNLSDIAREVAQKIIGGGLVVLPFDTVYGFACSSYRNDIIEKIFRLKKRPHDKTIGLATDSIKNIDRIAHLKPKDVDLISKKTPGPYSFVLKLKTQIQGVGLSEFCQRDGTALFRIPDSLLVLKIISEDLPFIAQTSANIHGERECYSLDQLFDQYHSLDQYVDMIIDGGDIKSRGSSQIFDLTAGSPIEIERHRKK